MNGRQPCNKIFTDVILSPNSVLPEFFVKNTTIASKRSSLLTKCVRDVLEFAKEDSNRVVFALKVGLAMLLVSLLILIRGPFDFFGTNILWSILTVGVMFEYTVGTTLYRGFNRAIGTLVAGIFAIFVIGLTIVGGPRGEPYVIAISIFLVGAATSFVKQWPSFVTYEYGFRVTLFTFCLIVLSTYRLENPIRTAMERLYSISIGAAVAVGVNVLVLPAWAGEQLHDELVDGFYSVAESLEECGKRYFSGEGLEQTTGVQCKMANEFPADLAHWKCRAMLNSSARMDSLAIWAKWEPPHGRFRHYYHTWSEYVKVAAVLRHCAYEVMALYGCLRSEIQAPSDLRITFQKEILEAVVDAAELLRSLAGDISNMKHSPQLDRLRCVHVSGDRLQRSLDLQFHLLLISQNSGPCPADTVRLAQPRWSYHEAMRKQNRRLSSWPSRDVDELEDDRGEGGPRMRAAESSASLSLATFALLLVEFVARLDHLVEAVDELAATAKFK
ncbi:aluminum-activated malate transporter 9-like [Zingiber officinale]|uniref:Uncharacterized protein n=1 Tax=Zingiber officinale TaxID=94328 RepID=A0A8J5M091_ZINOF|nr:aluminum-activated malate transporter 9-like [Zingiber officinale]XP_042457851.1 aluminum-activated malate transporter 9-like [Zingiber officinale]KAG6528889.1 hypothetical protein ZIOFF_011081 [Zingiber officinale]